jgi:predicted pyridoxine 5'-phosphate oxidase superfamily flavin-nucleotide-binding protein
MATLTEAMMTMVRAQRLGYVASVAEDGSPRVSPKGSLTVWDDTHLVFADIDSPHTVKNLSRNPRTEVNVVDPFLRKGYRFTGVASVLHTGAIYWKVLDHYKAEGADIRRVRAIVLIEITQVTPLVSPVYVTGFSEEEVGQLWEEFHKKKSQKTVLDLTPPSDF